MSKNKKHNISYIKPQDPKFLKALKAQAGFKEGPTIDTKRAELRLDNDNNDDDDDDDENHKVDEEPVIVVLEKGDLTAEEVEKIKKHKQEVEDNIPADLSKRIIFNRKSKSTNHNPEDMPVCKKNRKTSKSKIILSFNDEEDE